MLANRAPLASQTLCAFTEDRRRLVALSEAVFLAVNVTDLSVDTQQGDCWRSSPQRPCVRGSVKCHYQHAASGPAIIFSPARRHEPPTRSVASPRAPPDCRGWSEMLASHR